MDSDPNRNVGCTDLSGKSDSVPAPRGTAPTPPWPVQVQDRPPPWLPGHERGEAEV